MTPQTIHEAFHEQTRQLVQKLHREARSQVFETTMGAVNDSLAAILGMCDAKAREVVPFVKNAIASINNCLKEAREYYTEYSQQGVVDVNLSCDYMCNIIQCYFVSHALVLKRDLANIKALARGDTEQFEQFFLYLLLYLIAGTPPGEAIEVKVATRQKDSYLIVAIEKARHPLSSEAMEILQKKASALFPDKHYEASLTEAGGIRILLRLPLKFPSTLPKVTFSTPRVKAKIP